MKKFILFVLIVIFSQFISLHSQTKNVLLEQFTGSWCGWCVDGTYIMDQILEEYPDRVIGVKIHNGDSMAIPVESEIRSALGINSFPSGAVDRLPYAGKISISRTNWLAAVEANLALEPVVEVQTFYFIDDEISQINIKVIATVLKPITKTVKFNAYIIEDSVSGKGQGWDQSNYLSGRSGYEDNPYYNLPSKIVGYQHMKVVRAILGGAFGVGEIPQSANIGDIFTYDFSYSIPSNWKKKDIWVVGLAQVDEANSKEILNCSKGVLGEPEIQLLSNGDRIQVKSNNEKAEKSFTLKNISSSEKTFQITIQSSERTPSDWIYKLVFTNDSLELIGFGTMSKQITLQADENIDFFVNIIPSTTAGIGDVEVTVENPENPDGFKSTSQMTCYSSNIENFEIINNSEAQYSIRPILESLGYSDIFQITTSTWDNIRDKFPTKNILIWNTGAADRLKQNDVDAILADINEGNNMLICGNLAGSYINNYGGLTIFGLNSMGYSTQGYGTAPWRVWLSGIKGDPITNDLGNRIEGHLIKYLINLYSITDIENTKPIMHFADAGYKVKVNGSKRDTTWVEGKDAAFGFRIRHQNSRSVLINLNPFVIVNDNIRTELIRKSLNWLNNSGPELDLNVEEINFKYCEVNQNKKEPIIIFNPGNEALIIDEISISGMDSYAFSIDMSGKSLPITVQPNEYTNFIINFDPITEKDYIAQLNISSNSTMNPNILIDIKGTSILSTVKENYSNPHLIVYPNPAYDKLRFDIPTISKHKSVIIKIYDLNGNLLTQHKVRSSQDTNIDISNLNAGFYNTIIHLDNEVIVKSFVKF